MSANRRRISLLACAAGLFLLDRIVKEMILSRMALGESIPVIPDVLHITYVHNPGAAFSLFQQHPTFLLIVTSLLFLGFLIYSLLNTRLSKLETVALGLILGGALGNISDRLMIGEVVDYIDLICIRYPIFNLADSFIFCGITLLLVRYVRQHYTHPAGR